MVIVPPTGFLHAGDLPTWFDTRDPRFEAFGEPEVKVDLRNCTFVRPAAALWCGVYLLLAKLRGRNCEVLVPTNMGVCVYLKSLGLFRILKENGIEVDDRGIRDSNDTKMVLPLTRFDSQSQAEALANRANDLLKQSGLGSANIYPVVSETFAELAVNAVEHAESPIGAYGLIQFYGLGTGRKFVCSVADGGIGIRQSLSRNPAHRDHIPYDWVAIELATRERISGTLHSTRGFGLYGIAEDMRKPGRRLTIHSGVGALQISYQISESMKLEARRTRLFPGTLALASIPA
jgi:anti-sigma regulatory factor (Ser/Thr protein kinase)